MCVYICRRVFATLCESSCVDSCSLQETTSDTLTKTPSEEANGVRRLLQSCPTGTAAGGFILALFITHRLTSCLNRTGSRGGSRSTDTNSSTSKTTWWVRASESTSCFFLVTLRHCFSCCGHIEMFLCFCELCRMCVCVCCSVKSQSELWTWRPARPCSLTTPRTESTASGESHSLAPPCVCVITPGLTPEAPGLTRPDKPVQSLQDNMWFVWVWFSVPAHLESKLFKQFTVDHYYIFINTFIKVYNPVLKY